MAKRWRYLVFKRWRKLEYQGKPSTKPLKQKDKCIQIKLKSTYTFFFFFPFLVSPAILTEEDTSILSVTVLSCLFCSSVSEDDMAMAIWVSSSSLLH